MKNSLLMSTAIGALMATTSLVHAEGLGARAFGGVNWAKDNSFAGLLKTYSNTFYSRTHYTSGILGNFDFNADTGYVFGGAVGYGWDNGLSVEIEAAYRRNKVKVSGAGFFAQHYTTLSGTTGTKVELNSSQHLR